MGTRMTIARQRDSSRSRSLAKLWEPISQQHGAYQRCSKNFSACWLDARLFCGGQETKSTDGQLVRVAQILSHDNQLVKYMTTFSLHTSEYYFKGNRDMIVFQSRCYQVTFLNMLSAIS